MPDIETTGPRFAPPGRGSAATRRAVVAGTCAAGLTALAAGCAGGVRGPREGGEDLMAAAEVPLGGGTVLDEQGVVVCQPTEGEYRGYSTTCTHEGCPVDAVIDGYIFCPCHGSQFRIEDGEVIGGPAQRALPAVGLVVENGRVRLA
ncbi:Rieske (2Fe-2S) protein [Nocardiopsis sediminis]|uniref:Cytochrome bc1 complex Rieske iron-sulfur subunit n=1 Tax=Nocardiopsis sediminis TaxID=1778267 RepID=A0ABV8FM23_9ACTN